MSFHVGGHKPTPPPPKPKEFGIKNRLQAAAMGALLIFGGVFRLEYGVFVGFNWYRQPVFSHDLIAAGGVMILVALLPSSWIKAATQPPSTDRPANYRK